MPTDDSHSALLNTIGQKIRQIRISKGWSQEDLAKAAGLNRSYVGSVERGERNIRVLTLAKIAHVFDVKIEHFF